MSTISESVPAGSYSHLNACNAALHKVWSPSCVIITPTLNRSFIEQHRTCLQVPLLSICSENRICVLLNREAVELEPPALRNPYIGRTRGTIDHEDKEQINEKVKRAAAAAREMENKERKAKEIRTESEWRWGKSKDLGPDSAKHTISWRSSCSVYVFHKNKWVTILEAAKQREAASRRQCYVSSRILKVELALVIPLEKNMPDSENMRAARLNKTCMMTHWPVFVSQPYLCLLK